MRECGIQSASAKRVTRHKNLKLNASRIAAQANELTIWQWQCGTRCEKRLSRVSVVDARFEIRSLLIPPSTYPYPPPPSSPPAPSPPRRRLRGQGRRGSRVSTTDTHSEPFSLLPPSSSHLASTRLHSPTPLPPTFPHPRALSPHTQRIEAQGSGQNRLSRVSTTNTHSELRSLLTPSSSHSPATP